MTKTTSRIKKLGIERCPTVQAVFNQIMSSEKSCAIYLDSPYFEPSPASDVNAIDLRGVRIYELLEFVKLANEGRGVIIYCEVYDSAPDASTKIEL